MQIATHASMRACRTLLMLTMQLLSWGILWCKEHARLVVIARQKKVDQARQGAVQLDEERLRASEVNVLVTALDRFDDTTCNSIGIVDRHFREVGVLRKFARNQPGSRRAGRDVGDDDARAGHLPPQCFAEQ